jgi:hypothetical protein
MGELVRQKAPAFGTVRIRRRGVIANDHRPGLVGAVAISAGAADAEHVVGYSVGCPIEEPFDE